MPQGSGLGGLFGTPIDHGCRNCSVASRRPNYQPVGYLKGCSSGSTYMENAWISRMRSPGFPNITGPTAVPWQCVAASQHSAANGWQVGKASGVSNACRGKPLRYTSGCRYCKCVNGRPIRAPKPCASENHAKVVAAYFNATLSCFGMSAKKFFPMFHHESRFTTNISSCTGAGGLGQLTPPAINEVNEYFEFFQDPLFKDPHPACQAIKPYFRTKMSSKGFCQRVTESGTHSPVKNMIYSILYYKVNRGRHLNPHFRAMCGGASFELCLQGRGLSRGQIDKFEKIVLQLAHNMGPSAIPSAYDWFSRNGINGNNFDSLIDPNRNVPGSFTNHLANRCVPNRRSRRCSRARGESAQWLKHVQTNAQKLVVNDENGRRLSCFDTTIY